MLGVEFIRHPLGGLALAVLTFFPLFHMMADAANPALARATQSSPVTLVSPDCEFSVFASKQTTECGKALAFLSKRGISYTKANGEGVALKVGSSEVAGFDEKAYVATLEAAVAAAAQAAFAGAAPVVLLSPAAASFDQFSGFDARGDRFRDLAQSLVAQQSRRAS